MLKRLSVMLVASLVVGFLLSCKSVPDRVKELADNSYFQEASTVIQKEQEELSKNPDLGRIRELERAQSLLEERVAEHYGKQVEELTAAGKVREALKRAQEAFQLCPWSDRIKSTRLRCEAIVNKLDDLERKWIGQISSGQVSPDESHEVLSDLAAVVPSLSDSPKLHQLRGIATQAAVEFWGEKLAEERLHLSQSDESQMETDLCALLGNPRKATEIANAVRTVGDLGSRDFPNPDVLSGLVDVLYLDNTDQVFDGKTQAIKRVLQASFEDWTANGFVQSLVSASVSFDTVKEAEFLLESVPGLKDASSYKHALALGHLNRAKQLLKGGVSTTVALLHLQRSKFVDSDSKDAGDLGATERSARTYLSTVNYPDITLSMDINPAISLDIQGVMYAAFSSAFLGRSQEDRPWHLVDSGTGAQDVSIVIDSAELAVPELSKLPRVNSQFLSHYETVPNPAKESLRFQLSWEKSQVEMAESDYERAVSSYNWDPSDWNLNRVNSAYTRYKWAISSYNSLVDQFNMTPSTIEQPVFLPYSYSQGDVRFGCRISITCKVGTKEYHFTGESMDRSFVRIGTKPTDTNQSARRDVGLTFSPTFERFLDHINAALRSVCDQIDPLLLSLNYPSYATLSPDETVLLQCLMHPWGFSKSSVQRPDLPAWEKDALALVSVAQLQLNLPKIELVAGRAKLKGPLSPEAAAKALGPFVCLIKSIKDRQVVSTGSGTVIGPNGLVLTCAHILNAPDIEIDLSEGRYQGSYQSDIVFVNEKSDVAVLRAKRLANNEWASVRLKGGTVKGERIIAIGNPAIGQEALNVGGVSTGVVSNPKVAAFGRDQLVGDITVASGSSGGPLFSLDSGELVGIVQAVTRPGLDVEGVSSSGSYCLAAPADMLPKWLGLQYKH